MTWQKVGYYLAVTKTLVDVVVGTSDRSAPYAEPQSEQRRSQNIQSHPTYHGRS